MPRPACDCAILNNDHSLRRRRVALKLQKRLRREELCSQDLYEIHVGIKLAFGTARLRHKLREIAVFRKLQLRTYSLVHSDTQRNYFRSLFGRSFPSCRWKTRRSDDACMLYSSSRLTKRSVCRSLSLNPTYRPIHVHVVLRFFHRNWSRPIGL